MLSVYYGKLEKNHQRSSENIYKRSIFKCNNNHFLTKKTNLHFSFAKSDKNKVICILGISKSTCALL